MVQDADKATRDLSGGDQRYSKREEETRQIQRVASLSILINLLLVGIKSILAGLSGSLAITASAVDSASDAVASLAVLGGLKLSTRKTRAFPYGLYKIENILSVAVAMFIFFIGLEIAQHALKPAENIPDISLGIVLWLGLGMIITILFGQYSIFVGKRTESPTLIAEGRHRQSDVASTMVVLGSAVLSYSGLQISVAGISIDQIAAMLVLLFIVYAGWGMLSDGMRVLLDASISPEIHGQVRKILEAEPMVAHVKELSGRNAGRFRFIETSLVLRTNDLKKSHMVSEEIEARIMQQVPHVEKVVIHYEPVSSDHLRAAVPLADTNGTVSEHFGEAPWFAVVLVRLSDRKIEHQEVHENRFGHIDKGKGIQVAEWLVSRKVDIVFTREDLGHRGPVYVFSNAGIKLNITSETNLAGVLRSLFQDNPAREILTREEDQR